MNDCNCFGDRCEIHTTENFEKLQQANKLFLEVIKRARPYVKAAWYDTDTESPSEVIRQHAKEMESWLDDSGVILDENKK